MGSGTLSTESEQKNLMKKPNFRNNIAVLDIGKTHAKVILFDAYHLKELEVFQTENFILNNSLYPHFDIDSLKNFIINSLSSIAEKYLVDSIFASTHGACIALMSKGELALPVIDYEFDGPDKLKSEYDRIRPSFNQTGSPRMSAGLNLGAQLYWQYKYFPKEFAKIDQILFWPQYWTYWLTGICASEISYATCHSDLWDIKENKFVELKTFGIDSDISFPPIKSASNILGNLRKELANKTGLSENTSVYCGAHDSSLALVSAYLKQELPCSILSTGTWVTLFSLGSNQIDISEKPGLMISCDCFGNLVPNFRFPGGKIYERQISKKNKSSFNHENINISDISLIDFEDIEKARFVNKTSNEEINFHDIESNKAEAIISELLANQTLIGLQAIGSKGPIICSGPFAKNKTFLGTIEKKWDYPVIVEDNHLGICRGIADLVARK